MNGSVFRFALLGIMAIASALGVWAVHVSVAKAIGPVGAVLAAVIAALTLGTILWIVGAVARPASRGDGHGAASGRPGRAR
jgi:hypothetical protein